MNATERFNRDNLPFVPSDLAVDASLVRAVAAIAVAEARGQPRAAVAEIAREAWPRDRAVEVLGSEPGEILTLLPCVR